MRAHLRPLRGGLLFGLPVAAAMAAANVLLPIAANLWDKYVDRPAPAVQNTATMMS
jgi:hypothetical protein